MKFIIDNWFLILVAFVSGGMLVWPLVTRGTRAGAVSTAQAVLLINREKAVVVDVSEPAEYAAGHVAGARNIPFGSLEGARELPSNKSLPIIVVCPTGARASRAAATLRNSGYEKAVPLAGGTAAWREANLPIEKTTA
ncbi:rhodanese-like domain-containing protein [Caldimonas thermodepolymerans]|uniref:Rhodanese-related sulfurtransferase n=1 Tax=Caldimonas thermodepolymerans TaxID=215580 RepID=A0AA46HX00_9BURK|nr:rhodanese-like domain-containing protein [Caldimonas thermodepolymerans]TCP09022.1 rhodanese-related sulfurtransferase [Caldimonas thermodepolymerans]UZG47322.1 rhodanese-like domain-containing protein [Caldimonas thermodepolymerans]